MQWSVPIGVVKGTVIRVHLTFLLFLLRLEESQGHHKRAVDLWYGPFADDQGGGVPVFGQFRAQLDGVR